MRTPIAIAFSDLHINDPSKYNSTGKRTLDYFRVLFLIRKVCIRLEVPALFCGDMFHVSTGISNNLLNITMEQFHELDKKAWGLYYISGNHDLDKRNSLENPSNSMIDAFSIAFKFLKCIDGGSVELPCGYMLHGISYLDNNVGMDRAIKNLHVGSGTNILMIHSDFPGAKDTDGREIGVTENLNRNLLSKFDLTLMGHIHKPQKLGKKILMVGATHQQRRTDSDCDLGYWVIYSDLSREFVSLTNKFPRFIDVTDEEEVKDDGNYYHILPKAKEIKQSVVNTVTRTQSKRKVVKEYMKVKGIKDVHKKKTLIKVIKEADDD